MCGAVKPLFALPFYFLRLLQGWKSLNQSKRAAASVDEFHQLCDSPFFVYDGHAAHLQRCDSAFHQNTAADDQNDTKEDQPGLWREEKRADRHCAENQQHKTDILGFLT